MRGNLICFPVSHVYSFIGGGPNSIAKLDGDPWPEFPLDPPLNPSSSVDVVLFSTYSDRLPGTPLFYSVFILSI